MIKNKISETKPHDKNVLINYIVAGIREIKGLDIVDVNISSIKNAICDNFIICHGTSRKHVDAIADSVEQMVWKKTGEKPWHKVGFQNAEWVLLDYVDVVVHIFNDANRKFYNLEGLWADANINHFDPLTESK
jgi:ribosome-associated protein